MAKQRSNRAIALRISVSAVIASLAAGALAQGAPKAVGITAAILNDVRIASAGAPQPHKAVVRERVALADQVLTGPRSQLQVLLLDKSVFTVGANARLTIDRYVYDPGSGRSFTATVAKGAFRFMSGRPDRKGTSSIKTPVASIGIRGTIVDGVVGAEAIGIYNGESGVNRNIQADPATASLIVLRGPGANTQGNAEVGAITVTGGNKTVSLDGPMLAAYVPYPGAEPIGPFTISLSGLARLHALIFPALAERTRPVAQSAPTPAFIRPQRNPARPSRPIPTFPIGEDPGGPSTTPRYGIPDLSQVPRPADQPPGQDRPPPQDVPPPQDNPPPQQSTPPIPQDNPPSNQGPPAGGPNSPQ